MTDYDPLKVMKRGLKRKISMRADSTGVLLQKNCCFVQ